MQGSDFRGKLFFRYLLSYLAVVLIPLIIIVTFYSVSFFRAFSREVFSNVDKDFANTAAQLDGKFLVLDSIAGQVTFSPQLRGMPNRFEPESVNDIKQMLSNYAATNDFVSGIYLTMPDIGYVISSTSSYSLDYFVGSLFLVEGMPPEAVRSFFISPVPGIIKSSKILQINSNGRSRSVLISYPINTDYLKTIGTLVFQIPQSSIESSMGDKLSHYGAETIILDKSLSLIADIGASEETLGRAAGAAGLGAEALLQSFAPKYIASSYTSPDSGYTYINLIPRTQTAFEQISRLNYIFLFAMLLVVIISGLAIAYALRLNYIPLHRLHDKAGRMVHRGGPLNSLSGIENALEQLSGNNIYLAGKLEDNALSVKLARLQKLITNGYSSVEDFNMDCRELNMSLPGNRLFVTTSYIHTDSPCLDAIGLMLREQLAGKLRSYYVFGMETNKLVMIHCLLEESDPGERRLIELFHEVHRKMLDSSGILITTGIGSVVSGTTELSRSYLDSAAALDYRFVKGKGQAVGVHEINSGADNILYPQQYFEKLKNALRANNESSVGACIDEIIEIVGKNNYPLTMARGICFNLINIATNTLPGDTRGRPFLKPNLFALSEVETIQDLVIILKGWRQELHSLTTQPKGSDEALTIDKVMAYLLKNCCSCDFSIYETAEHFGMQLPRFSQYFKDQTNQNVLDYTIGLRMERAAQMLSGTNSDIKDIAHKTGYYNTSSFIRRFKQIHGVTPGDYRKFIREKGE